MYYVKKNTKYTLYFFNYYHGYAYQSRLIAITLETAGSHGNAPLSKDRGSGKLITRIDNLQLWWGLFQNLHSLTSNLFNLSHTYTTSSSVKFVEHGTLRIFAS